MRIFLVATVIVLSLALALGVFLADRRTPEALTTGASKSAARPLESTHAQAAAVPQPEQHAEDSLTATQADIEHTPEVKEHRRFESVLRTFWGPRWEELRPSIAKSVRLDALMTIDLPAWETVAGQVCEQMKMSDRNMSQLDFKYQLPSPLTLPFLTSEFETNGLLLTDADIVSLESQLEPVRAESQLVLEKFRKAVDDALAVRCEKGIFDFCPITNVGESKLPSKPVFVGTFAISGWVISYGVGVEDSPMLGDFRPRLAELKRQQSQVVQSYLTARKK